MTRHPATPPYEGTGLVAAMEAHTQDPMVVAQLTLEGIEVSATGATVTGDIDPVAVVAGLGTLSRGESTMRWVVGDLVLALDDVQGAAETRVAIAGLGYSQSWLATSIEVARLVPPAHRRRGLSWGHHEVAARLELDEQPRWLEQAEAAGWSIRMMAGKVDEWQARDQGELDGVSTGAARAPWKVPPVLARRMGEILTMDPDAWLVVHPKTGEARLFQREDS